jgi:hypothetical protein
VKKPSHAAERVKRTVHVRKLAWIISLIGVALLITAISVITFAHSPSSPGSAPKPKPSKTPSAQPAVYFYTLRPGAKLPSSAECARLVDESPSPELRPANAPFNHTRGQHVPPAFFPQGDTSEVQNLASLINGDFTGTTEDILRWAACKWGIDQDVVFAQAAVESSWQQNFLGDWTTDGSRCPPGRGIGADGVPGQCAQSYGILQNNFAFEQAAWPGIATSTAMNADVTYAIWRSCFNGDEIWLNNEPRGQQYHAGDLWGCVGRWFAGAWYTDAANRYISKVQQYLSERIWLQPAFRTAQPSTAP